MKTKHEHKFVAGHFNKIATCDCGKWKYINLKAEDIMTEIPVQSRSKHTPTPWESNKRYNQYKTDQGDVRYSVRIGQVANALGDTLEDAEANAEFIVRAVNSHEALLEAAKKLLEQIGEEQRNRGLTNYGEGFVTCFDKLRQAIALAEGKGE